MAGYAEVNKSRFPVNPRQTIVFEGPGAQVPQKPYDSDPPGGISGAEALTSTHSFVANETTRMLHILHILAFPEPRFVNPGFSGNPDIRASGYRDFRISDVSNFPDSGSSTPAAC